jgi:biopolymer transport protein ExbD
MAIFVARRKKIISDVTMASTADIAFLLIIFFIVSTIFAVDQGLFVLLPPKQRTSDDVVKVKQSKVATLRIAADDSITLDRQPIALAHVKAALEARLAAEPETAVILETHPDAHYGVMVSVLDELKLASARKLTLRMSARR